jgi:hypothetical protein
MVIILLGSCLIFGQERLTTLVSFRPELRGFHGQFSTGVNTSLMNESEFNAQLTRFDTLSSRQSVHFTAKKNPSVKAWVLI